MTKIYEKCSTYMDKGVLSMKRYTELLYWHKYRDMIHYDKKADTYYYDPELPERARKSFEAWLAQADNGGRGKNVKAKIKCRKSGK